MPTKKFIFMVTIVLTTILVVAMAFFIKQRAVQDIPTSQPASASPSPSAAPLMSNTGLIGIWHALPMMPSGWAEHYNFYPDHTFQLWPSTMDCKNTDAIVMGTWQLYGTSLKLEATKKLASQYDLDRTTCLKTMTSQKTVPIEPSEQNAITLSGEKPETKETNTTSFEYASMMLGNTRFWKFNDDPTQYGSDTFPSVSAFAHDGRYEYCPSTAYCDFVTIQTNSNGATSVTGKAYWQGSQAGNLNVGDISGTLTVKNALAVYDILGCTIDFTFSPGNTSVSLKEKQDSICGGLNVSFDGTYEKK